MELPVLNVIPVGQVKLPLILHIEDPIPLPVLKVKVQPAIIVKLAHRPVYTFDPT
jgi:hypothetical protein